MPLLVIVAVAFFVLLLRGGASAGDVGSTEPIGDGSSVDDYSPLSGLADAWARAEGFYKQGSLPQRINNPAAIKGNWPGVIGHTSSGLAIFSDAGSGFSAAQSWLAQQATQHPTWTLRQLFAKVLGDLNGNPVNNEQGNSDQEAENVASFLGVDSGTEIGDYMGMS